MAAVSQPVLAGGCSVARVRTVLVGSSSSSRATAALAKDRPVAEQQCARVAAAAALLRGMRMVPVGAVHYPPPSTPTRTYIVHDIPTQAHTYTPACPHTSFVHTPPATRSQI